MRVLHVIRSLALETGGPAVALAGLSDAQAAAGCEVTILAAGAGEAIAEPKRVRLELVDGTWVNLWGASAFTNRLDALLPNIDIVHAHMIWDYPILASAHCCLKHNVPFILRACGQLDRWSMSNKKWKKRLYLNTVGRDLKRARAIHYTTLGERNNSEPIMGIERELIIPNGVSIEFLRDSPSSDVFRRRFPALKGRPFVLYLGRIHPKKQPDLLITAFAKVALEFPDWRLVLAGTGEEHYLHSLKLMALRAGIADRIIFAGLLARTAVIEAFRAAQVFCLPSLQENFGVAVAEAMASNCPVIVSNRMDLAESIAARQAGLVCDSRGEGLVESLHLLMTDRERRMRMGANGRALVVENYSWDAIARTTLQAYQNIIEHG